LKLFELLTSNYLINVGFVAWCSAQILKTIFHYLLTKEIRLERLTGAGGMPSSHSALVCSVSLAMARGEGFDSPGFALSLVLAMIVMYDAMGVRRAAGEQAKLLNKLVLRMRETGSNLFVSAEKTGKLKLTDGESIQMLKEFLGHTPFEVLGGALLGILIAMAMPIPLA